MNIIYTTDFECIDYKNVVSNTLYGVEYKYLMSKNGNDCDFRQENIDIDYKLFFT